MPGAQSFPGQRVGHWFLQVLRRVASCSAAATARAHIPWYSASPFGVERSLAFQARVRSTCSSGVSSSRLTDQLYSTSRRDRACPRSAPGHHVWSTTHGPSTECVRGRNLPGENVVTACHNRRYGAVRCFLKCLPISHRFSCSWSIGSSNSDWARTPMACIGSRTSSVVLDLSLIHI